MRNPYDALEDRLSKVKTLEEASAVLSELLADGYAVWEDGTLYNVKQLVARVEGLEIHIYPNEHSPPHFHVRSADVDASFTIADCAPLRGNLDGREQKLVRWWFERSRPLLVQKWNSLRPSDCSVGPIS